MKQEQPFNLSLSAFSATLARNGIDISSINLDILNQAAAAAAAAVQSRPSQVHAPSSSSLPSSSPPAPRRLPHAKSSQQVAGVVPKAKREKQLPQDRPSSSLRPPRDPPTAKGKAEMGLRGQPWDPRLKSSSTTTAPTQRRRTFAIRLIPARALLLPFEARPPVVLAKYNDSVEEEGSEWCLPSTSFYPPLAPLSPSTSASYSRGPFVAPYRLDGHKLWSETVEEWEAYDRWHMEEKEAVAKPMLAKPTSPPQRSRPKSKKKKEGQVVETEAQRIKREPLGPRKWEMILKRAREAVGRVEAEEHAIRVFEAEGWRGAGREKVRLTAELERATEASERAKAVIRECVKETEDTTGFRYCISYPALALIIITFSWFSACDL